MTTNLYQLTASYRAIQSKKRAQQKQLQQVIFDEDNRREFLTGFHKRKVVRTEAARVRAKEKEKIDRLEARRQRRQALRKRAIENAVQLERACGAISDDSDQEWHGISSNSRKPIRDEEYENEEVLATVTIVEDFDPDIMIHGPSHPISHRKFVSEPEPQSANVSHPKPKLKSSKVYYETKHARRKELSKQHARKLEKAERAGGKASRKSRLRKRR